MLTASSTSLSDIDGHNIQNASHRTEMYRHSCYFSRDSQRRRVSAFNQCEYALCLFLVQLLDVNLFLHLFWSTRYNVRIYFRYGSRHLEFLMSADATDITDYGYIVVRRCSAGGKRTSFPLSFCFSTGCTRPSSYWLLIMGHVIYYIIIVIDTMSVISKWAEFTQIKNFVSTLRWIWDMPAWSQSRALCNPCIYIRNKLQAPRGLNELIKLIMASYFITQ